MTKQDSSEGFYDSREFVLDVIRRENLPLKIDDDDEDMGGLLYDYPYR